MEQEAGSVERVVENEAEKMNTALRLSHSLFHRLQNADAAYFFIANILFSISTMMVNTMLPKVLEYGFFAEFIYVFQMVLFATAIFQVGIVVGLYHFIDKARKETLSIYYSLMTLISIVILILALFPSHLVLAPLNLQGLSSADRIAFFLSVLVSNIFLYNKGKNVADKAYRYMLRISCTAMLLRVAALGILWYFRITSTCLALYLLFVLPFYQDICDYIRGCIQHIRPKQISRQLLKEFLLYSLKIWVIGALFNIADRIFLISTKGLDTTFTTALAFSAGLVGIINLFNSSFINYFMSNLSPTRLEEVCRHILRLKRYAPPYFILLIVLCAGISGGVWLIYPELGAVTALVTFVVLLRTGFISYLGMFSLLTKVLDMLNLEIILNLLRIMLVAILCFCWQSDNLFAWFCVVTFSIPLPEVVMTLVINKKYGRMPG